MALRSDPQTNSQWTSERAKEAITTPQAPQTPSSLIELLSTSRLYAKAQRASSSFRNAVSRQSISTFESNGFLRKQIAFELTSHALRRSSEKAEIKITGILWPLATSACCNSMPLMPGICTSAIKHEVSFR